MANAKAKHTDIRTGRIYDAPFEQPATVVLVDRLWPRGVAKASAPWDRWVKDVAPSDGLRRSYHADGDFDAFEKAYRAELEQEPARSALADLRDTANLVLVTAAKIVDRSEVVVLKDVLEQA